MEMIAPIVKDGRHDFSDRLEQIVEEVNSKQSREGVALMTEGEAYFEAVCLVTRQRVRERIQREKDEREGENKVKTEHAVRRNPMKIVNYFEPSTLPADAGFQYSLSGEPISLEK